MPTITCFNEQGQAVIVPQSEVSFRPAVYGIWIENGRVLVLRHPVTGLWQPPGGIVTTYSTTGQAVRHFFRAVTGMTPKVGPLLLAEEQYRLDREEQAWRLVVLYYALRRTSVGISSLINFDNPARPEMVDIDSLMREHMQLGYEAVQVGRLYLTRG